jgi:hypothetical protein
LGISENFERLGFGSIETGQPDYDKIYRDFIDSCHRLGFKNSSAGLPHSNSRPRQFWFIRQTIERNSQNAADKLPVVQSLLKLKDAALGNGLRKLGFIPIHATKKVMQFQRDEIVVYVKRETRRYPLIIHPQYLDIAPQILALEGVESDNPLRPYINSNLSAFPIYEAGHRVTKSHFGFALSISSVGLASLAELMSNASISTLEGKVRLLGTKKNPLTERERLATARIGQGEFRSALIATWGGVCPIADVDHLALLRASHIKPWSVSSNAERLDPFNGILLCAHVDALFDRRLISFENDGRMLISSGLGTTNPSKLGLKADHAIAELDDRHKPYLAYHRAHVFLA